MKLKLKLGIMRGMICLRNAPQYVRDNILGIMTFANPAYEAAERMSPWGPPKDIPQCISLAREEGEDVYFPRGMDFDSLSEKSRRFLDQVKWRDQRNSVPAKFPPFNEDIQLSPEQKYLLDHFKESVKANNRRFGNYLFVSPTSTGKTITQALAAAYCKEKTLILFTTNLIRRAWLKDLEFAFGIKASDVGLIQQNKFSIGDQFTLVSVATLSRRESWWDKIQEHFGCVILDEAHLISGPTIHNFLMQCHCMYLLGGTATNKKEEGPQFYLPAIFGKVFKQAQTTLGDTHTSIALSAVEVVKTEFVYQYDPRNLDIHDLSLTMASDEARNLLVVRNVLRDYRAGKTVLIAVKRVAHVYLLHEMLKERGVKDANILCGDTNADHKYTEALIKMILNRKVRCLIATIQAIKLGGNLNPLDCMHLVWPPNATDLEQLIGRIRRRALGKEKTVMRYYLDKKVPYLLNRFANKALPYFRSLEIEGLKNMYIG